MQAKLRFQNPLNIRRTFIQVSKRPMVKYRDETGFKDLPVTTHMEAPTREPTAEVPPAPEVSRVESAVVIPRVLFNYIVIAVSCFVIGLAIGVFAYDRLVQNNQTENEELIGNAVAAVVAALPQQPAAEPTIDPNMRYDVTDAGNPAIGPADAPVTIIEFGDFNCGYCKRFFDETLQPLLQAYEGRVRFVYRDYPILGSGSVQAALAGECADDQGKFWGFHDRVYAEQVLTRDVFLQYAADLEMDVDSFTTCLDEATHQSEIQADYVAGAQLGVGGTPTFYINGKALIGAQPYENFVAVIEAELNAAASDAPAAS
jgi:protein-disulfide isomerase